MGDLAVIVQNTPHRPAKKAVTHGTDVAGTPLTEPRLTKPQVGRESRFYGDEQTHATVCMDSAGNLFHAVLLHLLDDTNRRW